MTKWNAANALWKPKTSDVERLKTLDNRGWTGMCGKCDARVPAAELELRSLPFGRGERWQCRNGCKQ